MNDSVENESLVVWFRQDLRLQDNEALQAAVDSGRTLIPVYILDKSGERDWKLGGASRWWLHHALNDLDQQLNAFGGSLVLRRGKALEVLIQVLDELNASAVYWNRRYEPHAIERDSEVKSALRQRGVTVQSFNSSLLHEPHTIQKKDGTPFKVFTPFWKHCLKQPKEPPVEVQLNEASFYTGRSVSDSLNAWKLLPNLSWDKEFYESWDPSQTGARDLLGQFIAQKMEGYDQGRDQLGLDGTSRLSPYLHFGQIGPRQIWETAAHGAGEGTRRFIAEIGWREFSYHLLYHFPHTPTEPLRTEFEDFPWETDPDHLSKWQQGKTGYPVVDAAMRQLWQTGWMHNRARMIVASLLVKHLLQPWQEGARWFWDTLVDADLASNTQGWQWTAGCGADASPYFRVFNPILQGEKFDPQGHYVRRWIPELSGLPNEVIHKPWEADSKQLADAGVTLGSDYPHPIIAHGAGRARALKAYELFKASNKK